MLGGVASCDRLLGLLSITQGNLRQAVVDFEDGLVFCETAGYLPELAWTCCFYAEALAQAGEEGYEAF